jgi:hypothetical protein
VRRRTLAYWVALPSEGKGQRFESPRARDDFNHLAEIAKELFFATEASRKHAEGKIWTDCRRFSANPPSVIGIEILLGNEYR